MSLILGLAALTLHCLPTMPTAPKAAPPAAVSHDDEQRITYQAAAMYLANEVHDEAMKTANPAATLDNIADALPEVLPQVFKTMGTAPDLAAVLLPEVTDLVWAYTVVEHGRAEAGGFGYVFGVLADNLKHGASPDTVRADARRVNQQLAAMKASQ
ncbi:hypothetical protein [Streptomyces sp. NPDC005486]|uniref:hypothetical protein n=1 Tax=Streptomyces sp. NPDC005486 TaxID=3155345 RepID=UPI0033A87B63